MCTAVTYKTKDFYFGRTLDYDFSYVEGAWHRCYIRLRECKVDAVDKIQENDIMREISSEVF